MSTVWLVVQREVREKLRSRAFVIVNVVLLTIVLLAAVLPGLLAGDDEPARVAALGDGSAAVLEAAGASGGGPELDVQQVADEDEARTLLADGALDAVVVDGQRVLTAGDADGSLLGTLDVARRVAALDGALADAGVDAQQRAEALGTPPLEVVPIGEDGEPLPPDEGPDGTAVAVGLGVTFLLYGLLIFYGQQVAQGIVQEKQSRVIEVLLATVRPVHLLGGKLLGLGLIGLAQILLLVTIAAVGLQLTDTFELTGAAWAALLSALPWFLLGYALYATLFAMAAAVVPKVEDLQSAMTAPIVLLIGSFFVAQFAVTDPGGTVARVGALVPFSAPIVHPILSALGEDSWPLALGGIASTLAATAVLVPLTARIHAGAALSTRSRVGLRDALRRDRA